MRVLFGPLLFGIKRVVIRFEQLIVIFKVGAYWSQQGLVLNMSDCFTRPTVQIMKLHF